MKWPGHKLALTLFFSVMAVWIAVMAVLMREGALPPEASGTLIAVFEPGTSSEAAFARITQAQGRPIRPTAFPFIWVVAGDEPGLVGRLKSQGAIGSYRDLPISPTIAGCFALADAKVSNYLGP